MKQKQIEDYTILVPKKLKCKYRNGYVRNMLGYLIFRWNGYAEQRENNGGWFYATNSELLETLGGSKTTLQKYQCKLVLDGTIEFRSGSFSGRKANEYRLPFLKKKCTEKCTEDIVDNQEVNTKKCTDKKHTERNMVEIEKKCTEKDDVFGHILHDPKMSEKCTEEIVENQTVEVKKCTEETPYFHTEKCTTDIDTEPETEIKKTYNAITSTFYDDTFYNENVNVTSEKTELENGTCDGSGLATSFSFSSQDWRNLLKEYGDNLKRVPSQYRRGAWKWIFKKFRSLKEKISNGEIPVSDSVNHFKSVCDWLYVSREKDDTFTEKLSEIRREYRKVALDRLFSDFKSLLEKAPAEYGKNTEKFSDACIKDRELIPKIYCVTGGSKDETEKALTALDNYYYEAVTPLQERISKNIKDPDEEYSGNGFSMAKQLTNRTKEPVKTKADWLVTGEIGDELPFE